MVRIRRARATDAELLWQWRNDPLVRRNSFTTQVIPWAAHEAWLAERLASEDTRIYLLEDGARPVAQVRYERRGASAEVGDISVVATERGKGYGKLILRDTPPLACVELKVEEVFAIVKRDNIASSRMFLAAGFRLLDELTIRRTACYRFTYSRPAEQERQR